MDTDIETASSNCRSFSENVPSLPPEPLKLLLKQHVLSNISILDQVDLECVNGDFLIIVDQFSGWLHVVPFRDETLRLG